jgi:hypothetical protein
MTRDKALELALDALERSVATCLDPYSHEQVRSRPEHFINQAITALRFVIDVENMASKSTYKKQLETKDEPVSCAECGADGGHALYCVACAEKFIAQTETKDEPVAIVISESGANVTHSWWHEPALPINTKLYTSPQRTWVGLTDEDKQKLATEQHDWESLYLAVQAKLKEKNT